MACIFFTLVGASSQRLQAEATVSLPPKLSDHKVLQRDKNVCIWGKAAPAERVTVEIDGQKKSTRADKSGNWNLTFSRLKVGSPRQLSIKGTNSIVLHGVQVGDVWICPGQSNILAPIIQSDAKPVDLADVERKKFVCFTCAAVCTAGLSKRGSDRKFFWAKAKMIGSTDKWPTHPKLNDEDWPKTNTVHPSQCH